MKTLSVKIHPKFPNARAIYNTCRTTHLRILVQFRREGPYSWPKGHFGYKRTFVFLSLFHFKIKNWLKIFKVVNWDRFDSVFDTIMNDVIDNSSICENPNFWLCLGMKILYLVLLLENRKNVITSLQINEIQFWKKWLKELAQPIKNYHVFRIIKP